MSRRERMRLAGQLLPSGTIDQVELALMRQLFGVAQTRAKAHGLELSEVEVNGHFRLERSVGGRLLWSVDLWPTIADWSRVAWREGFKGPVLQLPRPWTILDAVEAMITAIAEENIAADSRKRPKPSLRRRR